MKNLLETRLTLQDELIGKQKAGVLCYIIGMVVILSIYRLTIAIVAQLRLFSEIRQYQHHIQVLSTVLLILMLGLLWMAYRQWRSIVHEHEQLEAILTSIGPDMLIAIDRNNRILRCGGAVEELSGYTPEELIGQSADLLYHDRRVGGQSYEIQSAINSSGFHVGYATGRKKDAEDYLLEIQTSKLNGPHGGAVLILRNLDERQQARAQLQRRIRMDEVFAAVSTEFLRTEPDMFGNACQSALQQMADVFGHEAASVAFFDTQTGELRNLQTWQHDQKFIDPAFNDDLIAAAAAIQENDRIAYTFPADSEAAPGPVAALYKKWQIRSLVLSPMQLHGDRFGFLAMFCNEPKRRKWALEDTTLLQAITSTFMSGELSILSKELLQKTNQTGSAPSTT